MGCRAIPWNSMFFIVAAAALDKATKLCLGSHSVCSDKIGHAKRLPIVTKGPVRASKLFVGGKGFEGSCALRHGILLLKPSSFLEVMSPRCYRKRCSAEWAVFVRGIWSYWCQGFCWIGDKWICSAGDSCDCSESGSQGGS